jgi:hypothetical protein
VSIASQILQRMLPTCYRTNRVDIQCPTSKLALAKLGGVSKLAFSGTQKQINASLGRTRTQNYVGMGAGKDAIGTALDLNVLGDRHFASNLSIHRRRSHYGAVYNDQQSTDTHCTFQNQKD